MGVGQGDLITGLMEMTASNEWLVYIEDQSSGAYTYFYWLPGTSNPFNYSLLGELEAYADAQNEDSSIPHCDEYPLHNSPPGTSWVQFGLDGIAQQDTAWNTFTSVQPTWAGYFGNATVNCNFSVSWDNIYADLFWDTYIHN